MLFGNIRRTMAIEQHTIVFTIFVMILQLMETHATASIEFTPEQISANDLEDVHVSCRPKGLEQKAQKIVLMQIFRENEKPMAEIHTDYKFTTKRNVSGLLYEEEGHIDKSVDLSSLNMTLLKPSKDWSGTYICKIYYIDMSGMITHASSDGNLTVSTMDCSSVVSAIEPLMKKIAAVEERAKLLEETTKDLQRKTESFESERALLKNKIAVLEKDVSSQRAFDFNIIVKLATLRKQYKMLVSKDALFDSKLESTYTEVKTQLGELADKESVSSIRGRVTALEKSTETIKSGRKVDKASISSITKKVAKLEQHGQDQSTQITSLTNKDSAIESDLKKTNQRLSQEVKHRLADKASLTSFIKKFRELELKNGDNGREIQALKNKDSEIGNNLDKTKEQILQVVKAGLSDKETVTSYVKKVNDLEHTSEGMVNEIKSLTDKSVTVDQRLSLIEKTNAKQSKDTKSLADSYKKSITPVLNALNTLQQSNGRLFSQTGALQNVDVALSNRISNLERKHPNPKPHPCAGLSAVKKYTCLVKHSG